MTRVEVLLPNNPFLAKSQAKGEGALISVDQLSEPMEKFLLEVQAVSSDSGYWLSRGAIKALNQKIDSPK